MQLLPNQASTRVNLVGYTWHDHGIHGVVTPLTIDAAWSDRYATRAQNSQAHAWLNLLNRLCTILMRLAPSWHILSHCTFYLRYDHHGYQPSECHSAGLGLAIGLFNVVRLLNGSTEVQSVTGTGIVRFDGTVEPGQNESVKRQALTQISGETCLTAKEVGHLGKLQTMLMNHQFRAEE